MSIAACIDIGSNSVLLSVAKTSGAWITEIATGEHITRLGAGLLREGRLDPAKMEATCKAITEFVDRAKGADAKTIRLVGTQALRRAANSSEFQDKVHAATGLNVEIISGEEEARLSFLAADRSLLPDGPKMVFDAGGGSTEVIVGASSRIELSKSMPLGCVSLLERFPYPNCQMDLRVYLHEFFRKELCNWPRQKTLIGIGGTATALAAIQLKLLSYDPQKVHGTQLLGCWISNFAETFAATSEADRLCIPYSSPQRLKVLGPGIEIILALLGVLRQESMLVCDSGLRHAVIYEMLGKPEMFR